MADIMLPEMKLPDFKLPEGLREMTRDDIVNAAKDVHMPKFDLPEFDLSKASLPKQVTDRMPGHRRRTNPILPVAAFLAVGAAIAAAWYLITSPVTGPRIRVAVNDLRARMSGERTDLVRYDDDKDLGSLLPDQHHDGTTAPASFEPASPMSDLSSAQVERETASTF